MLVSRVPLIDERMSVYLVRITLEEVSLLMMAMMTSC